MVQEKVVAESLDTLERVKAYLEAILASEDKGVIRVGLIEVLRSRYLADE